MRGDLRLTARGLAFGGRLLPCSLGRGGIVAAEDKREGDGATPEGAHRIIAMLYRADRIPRPQPWARPVGPGDLWCDDSDHSAYNRRVPAPFDASHERLWRAGPLYDLILVTDWNEAAQPGCGSAIFMHQWRRPGWPTAGCIALARPDLHWLAGQLRPGARLIVPPGSPRQRMAHGTGGTV